MNPETVALAANLLRNAKLDLAVALRDSKRPDRHGLGMLTVCQTKKGNVEATYHVLTRTYTLTSEATVVNGHIVEGTILAQGTPREVIPVLASLYGVKA